jgi:hypothetical protein
VANATVLSAISITALRLVRSTTTPANGLRTIIGNMPARVAVASTVAEPVVTVSHQISENCTSALPSSDSACPDQMVKKRHFQFGLSMIARPVGRVRSRGNR